MKRLTIIAIFAVFTLAAISQTRIIAPKEIRDKSCTRTPAVSETTNLSLKSQSSGNIQELYEAEVIGHTYYDLQTNAGAQNRMFLYPDGFVGGTFTYGENFPNFSDRGTGYNKYANNDWGPWPIARIESDRCGWPSYAPWGANGEIVVAHYSGAITDGLVFSKRTTKGVGNWAEFDFMGPAGHALLWSRMLTSGTNHETIHLLALTTPIANGGTVYQGQDGALVYSRSSDGGTTWDIENTIIDGLGSAYYNGFDGDTYEFAYPKGNTIAMLIGHNWTDLILMKSTDNGNTWNKTLIWEHPYPLFDPNNMIVTDTFYCADGSHSVAIDNSGKVHVAFGINRAYCDGSGQYWFPLVDGLGYWNEDMPAFSNNINALSPYGEPGTELIEDYNLIGWMQDINGNGTLDILDDIATYYMGPSSMPQLVTDDQDQISLIYSSITETYDQGTQNYRHLWARGSNNNGLSWGDFHHLTNDLIYIFDESVFPSCSPTSDENIHFLYQGDNEPGMAVRGDQDPYGENYIHYYKVAKSDIITPDPGNTLTGIVTELDGGAPVQGATISIEGTMFTAISSSSGYYAIYGIPAGSYTVNCSKLGYVDESATVIITNSNTTILNFELMQVIVPADGIIGNTFYDLQSNASMQNRIYKYDDGTIGAIWIMGFDYPNFPYDRGTGYNFYNGLEWDVWPTEKLESVRAGWPSYMPFGENGEMVVSHDFSAGSIYILKREEKGTGEWSEDEFLGPGSINISWNRTITSGVDHNTIQVLALTWPIISGGSVYQGLDGALLYSRSTDGGLSWDQENVILNEMNSTEYYGFKPDNYEWAVMGDHVAFLVGSPWIDMFLMKSTDNGISWTKTVIWDHPYPLFDTYNLVPTDTFYCADGAHSLCFDETGKINVAFGITRTYSDGSNTYLFSEVDGIGFWNEDMSSFSNNLNALSPYGDSGSELIQDYNLIAWSQDVNGNGQLDFLDDWGNYNLGVSSMPQLIIDDQDNRYLIYSSVTEGYDNGTQNYRHLWARGFNNTAQTWGGFLDLNQDLIYIFSECVFPSCSPTSDSQIHLIFQEDSEPGMAVTGDLDPYGDNNIIYMNVLKADILPGLDLGILAGTVTESFSGNPVSDATITIQGTAFWTYSNTDGSYEITGIPSGTYTVICEKTGYNIETVVVEIIGNNTTTQNFQLEEPAPPVEEQIGETWYDLQSNASMQNRIYKYDDGTIGAIWTMGFEYPSFGDRGTGYNYYDGTNWGPFPADGIEPDRTGWPSYAPWGSNGEIVVAHYSGASTDGLVISSRQNKGTGDWNGIDFYGPSAYNYYLWPRATSGGNNHNDLHIIALTAPISNGGTIYQGMDGALLYSRSPDGGLTWDHQDVLFDEINSSYYFGFGGDTYEIQTQEGKVAFLVGDEWTDLVLMKSLDNGDTWDKTIIWEHPYPLYNPGGSFPTDTFYNVDGAHSLAFDQTGKIHVAFGINRSYSDGSGTFWFPSVDGIGYWNEDMPAFSNDMNALSPYGDPGSELIPDYNLIGWSQDINGNGQLDILDDWGTYYLGFSSMPQLVVDEMNNIFLVYSSVTEGYDNGSQNYRHLWARGSNNNGQSWGEFIDLNEDLIYTFSECVFPSLSPTMDNSIHLIFMEDWEPGMAVRGDEDPYGENHIKYMNILKSDIVAPAQAGSIYGTITDAVSGLSIEGAIVILSGTNYSSSSNETGYYFIEYIPPGDYTAICTKMGYLNASSDVTIVEYIPTLQDFELEEAIGLNPPENLTATIFDENNVSLDWDPPLTGTPIGYHVYRNNNNIGFYTITSGIDYGLDPGNYTYFITAVYDVGESLSSNTVEVIISEPLLTPVNLTAWVDDNDVTLMWDPPGGGNSNGEWIQWDAGVNNGNGIGLTSGGTFYVASHWEPADLVNFDGMKITEMAFFANDDPTATFELMAWTGVNAGIQIMSQPVTNFIINSFNEVSLSTPIVIDASIDLWFGYAVTHIPGTFPAGADDGPAIPFNGDMISLDGITWESMSTSYPALDYNWNLAAYVEELDDMMIVNKPMMKKTIQNTAEGEFLSSISQGFNSSNKIFNPLNIKDLLYYNIYRDENLIGNTAETFYLDLDLNPGSYDYCVTSVYDEGESECSETVIAVIPEPCYPPENVTAAVINITEVELTWDPPISGSPPTGYNVYQDGLLIGFVTNNQIYFAELGPGTYEFCVSSVCEEGESEPACADPVTITLLPPVNLEAEISGSDIILTWDGPQEKALNGYNVYHNYDNGNFSLFAYVTQTTCLYVDASVGFHNFYVTVVYDQGESVPSDTVEVVITSVDNNLSQGITIHPNPASDFVNIKSDFNIKSVKVYNHKGQVIGSEIVNDKFYKFNTSQFPTGLYFFQVTTSEGVISKRVIIK